MLKRPKIRKREDSASTPTTGGGGGGGGGSAAPPPLPRSSGKGVTTAQLAAALGGSYVSPTGGGGGSAATGVSVGDLGYALSTGGTSAGNSSVASSRHTSYPQSGDLHGLPAKAGTRTGPRTTSYRIPLQRNVQSNVYDTVN
jgi:hypothetical protein